MSKATDTKKRLRKQRLYSIIRAPLVTEKSTQGSELNKYTFSVALDATKNEVKLAIEEIFKTKVESVNTLVNKGKTKRFRGIKGQRNDRKKAIVTLAEGSSIDIASGI